MTSYCNLLEEKGPQICNKKLTEIWDLEKSCTVCPGVCLVTITQRLRQVRRKRSCVTNDKGRVLRFYLIKRIRITKVSPIQLWQPTKQYFKSTSLKSDWIGRIKVTCLFGEMCWCSVSTKHHETDIPIVLLAYFSSRGLGSRMLNAKVCFLSKMAENTTMQ